MKKASYFVAIIFPVPMNSKAIYYNQYLPEPQIVTLLIFRNRINIYKEDTRELLGAADLSDCKSVELNGKLNVYLDSTATAYLTLESSEPGYNQLKQLGTNSGGRSKRRRNIGIITFATAIILGAFIVLSKLIPMVGLSVISPENEIAIGKKFYQSLMEGKDVNIEKTHLVTQFIEELELSDKYPVKVTVVNDSIVNAFALPGGNVVVYTGLLSYMQSSEEFAALLCHEASHVNGRHSLRAMLRSVTTSVVLHLVFGDASGLTSFIVENADMLRELSYSRSLEKEADEQGMKLMIRNKIDPSGMKDLMATLENSSRDGEVEFEFLSTHPLTKERVKHADKFLSEHVLGTGFERQPKLDSLWNLINNADY